MGRKPRKPIEELKTVGQKMLDAWALKERRTSKWVASQIKASPSAVGNWRKALASPNATFRHALERLTDSAVLMTDWETAQDRKAIKAVKRCHPAAQSTPQS